MRVLFYCFSSLVFLFFVLVLRLCRKEMVVVLTIVITVAVFCYFSALEFLAFQVISLAAGVHAAPALRRGVHCACIGSAVCSSIAVRSQRCGLVRNRDGLRGAVQKRFSRDSQSCAANMDRPANVFAGALSHEECAIAVREEPHLNALTLDTSCCKSVVMANVSAEPDSTDSVVGLPGERGGSWTCGLF